MLRSLFSGISGLRAHQTMLDVTGNNIANVNTAGYKSSATVFQDTLSQLLTGASAPQGGAGGTNPAQVGLGVRVAGVTTNFSQGSAQLTNKSTDMMISGDGFFIVNKGGQQLYTRAGSFGFDAAGNLVTPDGAFVEGWPATNGVITAGQVSPIKLPVGTLMGATATTNATFDGNLPSDAATGTVLTRQVQMFDPSGAPYNVDATFTKSATAGQWDAAFNDPTSGASATATLTFDATGKQTSAGTATLGTVALDLSKVTDYASLSTIEMASQDGRAPGELQSFTVGSDGTITGSFSNGLKQDVGRVALASFTNPAGLEKAGDSTYRASANSGAPSVGQAGSGSRGTLSSGVLEMSNVDLSGEFTQLIVAQRGFQASARVITTSDDVLQELMQLKR